MRTLNKINDLSRLDRFILFEGLVPHFYLDGKGIVTIGIGCQIPNVSIACELNLLRKQDRKNPTVSEKTCDWMTVKNSLYPKSLAYYNKLTFLCLSKEDAQHLFERRLNDFITQINEKVIVLGKYPLIAQEVLLDMCFNLGINGVIGKFPKFLTAFVGKDWKTCAAECHRLDVQDSRNDWARESLSSLI